MENMEVEVQRRDNREKKSGGLSWLQVSSMNPSQVTKKGGRVAPKWVFIDEYRYST